MFVTVSFLESWNVDKKKERGAYMHWGEKTGSVQVLIWGQSEGLNTLN